MTRASLLEILDELLRYVKSGGFVMPPLVLATLVLWFALGWRLMTLQRGSRNPLRTLVERAKDGRLSARDGVITRAVVEGLALVTASKNPQLRPGCKRHKAFSEETKIHHSRNPNPQIHAPQRHVRNLLDDAFATHNIEMSRFSVMVSAVVAAAPLTGLLGTVTGMIETFDSLGNMSLFSQSGGIAGGIAQALISTQMGLAVAIPGLVVGRILARKQALLSTELEELKELLCSGLHPPKTSPPEPQTVANAHPIESHMRSPS